jgi:hypothetical protein
MVRYSGYQNRYKSCVLCPHVCLQVPGLAIPYYLLSDGYPIWRLPDIKLRHWRPPWGDQHDHWANSKDLIYKINIIDNVDYALRYNSLTRCKVKVAELEFETEKAPEMSS